MLATTSRLSDTSPIDIDRLLGSYVLAVALTTLMRPFGSLQYICIIAVSSPAVSPLYLIWRYDVLHEDSVIGSSSDTVNHALSNFTLSILSCALPLFLI